MPIRFACPACRTGYTVGDQAAGRKAECRVCGQRLQVPVPARLKTVVGEMPRPVLTPDPPPPPDPAADLVGPLPSLPDPVRPRPNVGVLGVCAASIVFLLAGGVLLVFLAAHRARELDTPVVVQTRPDPPKAVTTVIIQPRAEAARSASERATPTTAKKAPKATGKPPAEPPIPPGQALSGEQAYRLLVRRSVLVSAAEMAGTGLVVSVEKRLVLTNYHVVLKEDTADLVFPLYSADGEPITDVGHYRGAEVVRGKIVARDTNRDLALIRAAKLPDAPSAFALTARPAAPGSTVWSVGGSGVTGNLLWRLTKGTVRGRTHRQTVATFGLIDCMILETDAPVNQGDSGGPVVNDRGELVGVTSHTVVGQRQVSGIIDVEEVRAFLDKHLPR